jgi:hypothetical protein
MARPRLNPRIVALLAYALVLNALVWAGTAVHRFEGSASAYCKSGSADSHRTSAPAKSSGQSPACDLACAAAASHTAAIVVAQPLPQAVAHAVQALEARARAPTAAVSAWQARAPPVAA